MVIDFHTHIFPREIRENREKFFIGESAFKLLYDSPKSRLVGAEELVGVMDEEEVDVSVVFGFPWNDPEIYRMHNDYIMDAVSRFPDHLAGFGCFGFSDGGRAEQESARCLDGGLDGIGELAFYECGIDNLCIEMLTPVMEICLDRDVPVLIHTNEPVGHQYPGKAPIGPDQIYNLARRFPDNKTVLAHWGGGIFFYSLLKKEVKDTLKNIYLDTAASPFLYEPGIYSTAISLIGPDRILLGSDYPLLKPSRYFRELEETSLSRKDREKICGLNAMKLLKLA